MFNVTFWCYFWCYFFMLNFVFIFWPYRPQNYLFGFCASIRLCGGCIWRLLIFLLLLFAVIFLYHFSMLFLKLLLDISILLCYFLTLTFVVILSHYYHIWCYFLMLFFDVTFWCNFLILLFDVIYWCFLKFIFSKLCNQVRSLSLFRWRTLTLLNI